VRLLRRLHLRLPDRVADGLMRDRGGRWWVLEVNSIPAWRGLQRACGVDIAAVLADDLLQRCFAAAELAAV
jgi:hypothetical protein